MVLPTFYLLLDWLRSLNISNGKLLEFLEEEVSWINALLVKDNVYFDLVRVVYSDIDTFLEKDNRVFIIVGRVLMIQN